MIYPKGFFQIYRSKLGTSCLGQLTDSDKEISTLFIIYFLSSFMQEDTRKITELKKDYIAQDENKLCTIKVTSDIVLRR